MRVFGAGGLRNRSTAGAAAQISVHRIRSTLLAQRSIRIVTCSVGRSFRIGVRFQVRAEREVDTR